MAMQFEFCGSLRNTLGDHAQELHLQKSGFDSDH